MTVDAHKCARKNQFVSLRTSQSPVRINFSRSFNNVSLKSFLHCLSDLPDIWCMRNYVLASNCWYIVTVLSCLFHAFSQTVLYCLVLNSGNFPVWI